MDINEAKKIFGTLDINNISIPELLSAKDKEEYGRTLVSLNEIKKTLEVPYRIVTDKTIPREPSLKFGEIVEEFISLLYQLINIDKNTETEQFARTVTSVRNKISSFYSRFFDMSPTNKYLFCCNSIKLFEKEDNAALNLQTDDLIQKLNEQNQKAGELIKNLETRAGEIVVTDYAKIFETQEINHKTAANWWLGFAIPVTIGSIICLVLSIRNDWFQINNQIFENNILISKINYANLVTKILVVSLVLFLISFFYRQYGVNKNLQTINNHRKNALNSYKLFVESIGTEDVASRNALMLQVAKAIYENSSTGYISTKSEDSSSSVIELTKFVSNSKGS